MNTTTKKLARAGVTAALYAAITILLAPISYGIIQFRPAEALTLLPMFFAESPIAVFVGCMLANIMTGNVYDVLLGSLITLVAAYITRFITKRMRNPFIGGVPPIILNAVFLPFVFYLGGGKDAYLVSFVSLLLSETVSVYLLGIPMYYAFEKLRKSGNRTFNDDFIKKEQKYKNIDIGQKDKL